jgi:hypothetical protein
LVSHSRFPQLFLFPLYSSCYYFFLIKNQCNNSSFTKKEINIISAKLFYKKQSIKTVVQKKVKLSEGKNEQKDINKNNRTTSKIKAPKAIELPPKSNTSNTNNNLEERTHKNTITPRISSLDALQSLREKIYLQKIDQGAKEHYQAFIESKKILPRSTTKLNQLPEAKAVEIKVDCSNTFNKGLKIISGMLGGSIKCNRFNGSQKFIDARLEKMGK